MKISVIIPMYNSESTIERAIYSVINQTYSSAYEVIVVNDGSTDGSKDKVSTLMSENPRIEIKLINQVNGGVSKARNAGLQNATGTFIAFLDADDEWLPFKIAKQISVFEQHPEVDFLAAIIHDVPDNHESDIRQITLSMLIYKNYFQPSTVMMRRTIFESVGFFNEEQKYAEEGNYFMRIAKLFNCFLLYQRLTVYGDGKIGFGVSGLSANLYEMERGELMNLKFAYRQKYIGTLKYGVAVAFSIIKYFRRILIVKTR